FNAIMYDRGGMSREERELGALAASMVNRCVYCAAVHADRHAKLAKDETVTDELFAKGEMADLDPRNKAIFDFSRKAAEAPPSAGPEDIEALSKAGLSDEEIFDLILSSSLFGWANRLMHVLGDPVSRKETA
ncbi:MAG: peroxidase-related enzyme, partial [Desulfobacterales bacterium]|nr:peroxidase-related enzyme [Desulfobacterales bacterium]